MSDGPLFAGAAMRRLRRRESLTQAAMAERLSISPSYLNLIERNQRPLSARVMVQVVEQFDFDPRSLREDESIGGVAGLARRFADERFSDLGIDRDEIAEFLATVPQVAAAFARLYDTAGEGTASQDNPIAASQAELDRWRNHFADLDEAAEQLADELRLSHADMAAALTERLRERHRLSLRILPADVMGSALRRMDLHARQLQLSEMLDASQRSFQVALQLAHLEQREAIAAIASGARLADESARALFQAHLADYFVAATLLPYSRLLRACDATGYDLHVLQRRFNVDFETLAMRLTTLQRVGQRGLPFFMARIGRAGIVSQQFLGASGANWIETQATCARLAAHRAFERPGEIIVESVSVDGISAAPEHWLLLVRTVDDESEAGLRRHAVMLGIEARLAGNLAQARGISLRGEDAVPIGMTCHRCHRLDCRERSALPRGAQLRFDPSQSRVTPYDLGEIDMLA